VHGELTCSLLCLRLSQAHGHLRAGEVFVQELHLGTPVRVRVWWWGAAHRGGTFLLGVVCCTRRRPGSQRSGEDQAGLEGGALGAAGLPPGESELVPTAQALCLRQTLGLLVASEVLVEV
jgi:hypothetical protein